MERGNLCATSANQEENILFVRNCDRDEGRPFGVGVQAQIPNHLPRL